MIKVVGVCSRDEVLCRDVWGGAGVLYTYIGTVSMVRCGKVWESSVFHELAEFCNLHTFSIRKFYTCILCCKMA